jgi:hypothetical protein
MLKTIKTRALVVAAGLTAALLVNNAPATAQVLPAPTTGAVSTFAVPQSSPLSQPSPQTVITPPPVGLTAQPNLNSFSERTIGCLNQGAATGLDPNSLSAYTRGCAN